MEKKEFGKRFLSLALVLVMVFGLFGTQVTAAQMTESEYLYMLNTSITIDGKANAIILLPEDASDYEKLAAKELQEHIELVSGAWLPITNQATGRENSFDATISTTAMETPKAGYYPFTITLDNPTDETVEATLAQVGSGKVSVLVRGDEGMDGKVTLAAGQRATVNCLIKVSDSSFENQDISIAVNKNGEELKAFKITLTGAGQVASFPYVGLTTFSNSQNWTLGSGSKLDKTTGHNGSKNSLKITGKSTVTHRIPLGLTSGNMYRLRFWAKTDAAGATVVAKLADSTAKGAALPATLNTQKVISGTDWKLYEYFFAANVSGDKDYATSMLTLVCNGNLWIDDLSLVDCSNVINAISPHPSYDYSDFEYDPNADAPGTSYQDTINKLLYWHTVGDGYLATVSNENAHSGKQSFKISVPGQKAGTLQWGLGLFKDGGSNGTDDNGKNHIVAVWAKAEKAGTPLEVWAANRDASVRYSQTFLLSTEWTRYEVSFIPEGLAHLGALIGFTVPMDASATGNRVVYLDDVYTVNTSIADAALEPDEAVEEVPQQPEVAAPAKMVSTSLKFFLKEDVITAGQIGYYPFSLVMHNISDKTMNLVLEQAERKEGDPVIQIRGESELPDKNIDTEAEDFDPGTLPPTALEPDYSLPDDAFDGKVTLDAGERVIISGLVAVTKADQLKKFPLVVNAKDGDNLVAQIPLQVNVIPSVNYIGNTTFKSDINWTLDANSSLDGSVGYQDSTSLKVTGSAKPTHTAGVSMISGNLYRLRFWAKADSKGTIQAEVVDCLEDNTAANKSLYMTKAISGDWAEYNYYFVANSGLVEKYAYSKLVLNCKGNMWIDDLSLVDCGEPTNKLLYAEGKDYTAFEYNPADPGPANYWNATVSTAEMHSGSQSCEIKAAPAKSAFMQWGIGMLKSDSDINVSYTISFWAKAQQDGTPVSLTMTRTAEPILHTFTLSDKWEHYEFEWTPEEPAANGMGYLFRLTLPAGEAARTVWIDDTLFLPTSYPASIATPNEVLNKRMPSRVAPEEPQFMYLEIEIATADAENTKLREKFAKEITFLETLTGSNGRNYSSDGFAVQKRDRTIYIFGTEDRGTLNGVYDFIEYNADVVWPRAGKVAYQENENIQLKKYNYYEKSPFSVRGWNAIGVGNTGTQNVDTDFDTQQSRNKMNAMYIPCYANSNSAAEAIKILEGIGMDAYLLGHNVGQWILSSPSYPGHTEGEPLPDDCKVYWNQDKNGTYLTNQTFGTPGYAQINMWDPNGKVTDCMVDSVIAYVEMIKEKGVVLDQVGIGMNDTMNMPQLGYDNKPFEYAPGKFVQPGDANYLPTVCFTFFNTMAQKLRDRGYDIKLNIFAYLFLNTPPACEIDENLSILFAPLQEDIRFPLNMKAEDYPGFENSGNIKFNEDLEGWSELTSDVLCYSYYGCFTGSQVFERSIGKKMQQDLKFFAEKGFRGMLPEGLLDDGGDTGVWAQNALTYWLYSKLLWNPNANVDKLIKEYCTKVYGVAANDMIQYYKLLQKAWDNGTEPSLVHFSYPLNGYLHNFLMGSGYVSIMQSYLNEAWKKADADLEEGDRIKDFIRPIRDNLDTHVRNTGLVDSEEASAVYTNVGRDTVLKTFDMSDGIWANCAVIKNFYRMGPDGTPTTHAGIDTNLRLLWDNQYLYIAYECFDTDIEDIVASKLLDDNGTWFRTKSDDIETFITTDPTGELLGYFGNPHNLHFRFRKMPSASQASADPSPCDYHTSAKIMEDRWVGIQAISFESLGITEEVTPETAIYAYFYRGYYTEPKASQVTLAWNGAGVWQSSATRLITLLAAGELPETDPNAPETQPSTPAETQPSAPAETQPSAPVETQPSAPVETQPSAPVETQPSAPVETQPSAPATQPGDATTEQPGTPVGLIIGVVAAVVVIVAGGAVAFIFYRKKKANETTESAEAEDTAEVTE